MKTQLNEKILDTIKEFFGNKEKQKYSDIFFVTLKTRTGEQSYYVRSKSEKGALHALSCSQDQYHRHRLGSGSDAQVSKIVHLVDEPQLLDNFLKKIPNNKYYRSFSYSNIEGEICPAKTLNTLQESEEEETLFKPRNIKNREEDLKNDLNSKVKQIGVEKLKDVVVLPVMDVRYDDPLYVVFYEANTKLYKELLQKYKNDRKRTEPLIKLLDDHEILTKLVNNYFSNEENKNQLDNFLNKKIPGFKFY